LKEENANLKLKIPNGETQKKRPRSETYEGDEEEVKGGMKYQPWAQLPLPAETTALSPDQVERYSRQLLLQEGFGVKGQGKMLSSSVLVVGAGGIGSTVLLYLAACGIGRISVLDFDVVETSNLHRQIIHKQKNVGLNKAVSACQTLLDLNPSIQCRPLQTILNHLNAMEIIQDHDCIVDASDNPRTRYLINDACVLAGKPLISGSAIGTEGQLSVFNWKDGPCYRCLFPKPSITAGAKSCSDNGVLGPVPGLIGVLQSLEVIKVLTDTG
jgi:adenylyltransferase and sulfurtransferase